MSTPSPSRRSPVLNPDRPLLAALSAVGLVILVVVVWSLARLSAPQPRAVVAPTATATATPLRPTPTPRLVIVTPRVLAAWVEPVPSGPCDSCYNPRINFTSNGPFDVVLTCNPQGVFAGSLPSIAFTLLDTNGHVVDSVQQDCGDPNKSDTAHYVVPEQLPAGAYSLRVSFPGVLS